MRCCPRGPCLGCRLALVLGQTMNGVHKQRAAESTRWWLERGSDVWRLKEAPCPVLL